jgi:curli biogenesis system outer membrane secretion channel CsgG
MINKIPVNIRLFTLTVALAAMTICASAQAGNLSYPEYSGPKKRVAVTGFEDKSGVVRGWNLGNGFSEMLTTAMVKTNRFIVLERQALGDMMTEHDLASAGLISKETAIKKGKMLGAQLIVRGAITEYQENVETKSAGGGVNVGAFTRTFGISTGHRTGDRVLRSTHAGGGKSSGTAHMAIDLRVIDAQSGQVLFSEAVEGSADDKSSGFDFGIVGINFGKNQSSSAPRQRVIRSCIYQAVQLILAQEEQTPWQTSVALTKGDKIYLSAGEDEQVRAGQQLTIESKGEAITDPDTGEVLDYEGGTAAMVVIEEVKKKLSIARVTLGKAGDIKRGDKARLATGKDYADIKPQSGQASPVAKAAAIKGQIVDHEGRGLADVSVSIPSYGITVQTDSSGRWDLSGKKVLGKQMVTFRKDGLLPRYKEIDFEKTQGEIKLDMIPPKA